MQLQRSAMKLTTPGFLKQVKESDWGNRAFLIKSVSRLSLEKSDSDSCLGRI